MNTYVKRDTYLNRLIVRRDNGQVKAITGPRRAGKSFLLDPIYKDYLLGQGVPEDHIISISFDIEDEDIFDKATIKKWMNSLDLPEIDSSYRFFAIKVDRNNLNKLHISQTDKLKLQNAGSGKVLIALVVSDSNLDTKESTVYVCNSISSELGIENEVTELHLK